MDTYEQGILHVKDDNDDTMIQCLLVICLAILSSERASGRV